MRKFEKLVDFSLLLRLSCSSMACLYLQDFKVRVQGSGGGRKGHGAQDTEQQTRRFVLFTRSQGVKINQIKSSSCLHPFGFMHLAKQDYIHVGIMIIKIWVWKHFTFKSVPTAQPLPYTQRATAVWNAVSSFHKRSTADFINMSINEWRNRLPGDFHMSRVGTESHFVPFKSSYKGPYLHKATAPATVCVSLDTDWISQTLLI